MSTEEANKREGFLGKKLRQVAEKTEHKEKESSSSSSDGSKEPSSNQDLTQFSTLTIQNTSQVISTSDARIFAPVSTLHSQQAKASLSISTSTQHNSTSSMVPSRIVDSLNPEKEMNINIQTEQRLQLPPPQNAFHAKNMPISSGPKGSMLNQPKRKFGEAFDGSSSNHHLPTSNLPLEFGLQSSRISPAQSLHSTPLRSQSSGFLSVNPYLASLHQQSMGSGEFQFQSLFGPSGRTGLDQLHQIFPNQQVNMNRPISNPQVNWISQGQATHAHNYTDPNASSSRDRPMRSLIYDPVYEAMGLPIDPHLRLFGARRGDGNKG